MYPTTSDLLDDCLSLAYFSNNPAPIPFLRVAGQGPLVVITGENASGKSFFRRIASALCRAEKIEFIGISMEGRRNVAYNIGLSFVYGDEQTESTGVNSASTVLMGIKTCRDREARHVIFWDEPDVGLSDGWAAGIGQRLCEFAQDPPPHTLAAFVVTHSRALAEQLLPVQPHYLHLGTETSEAPPSLAAWVSRPIAPLDPDLLRVRSRARFLAIQEILNEVRAGVRAKKS